MLSFTRLQRVKYYRKKLYYLCFIAQGSHGKYSTVPLPNSFTKKLCQYNYLYCREPLLKGWLSTIDLLVKAACFVKKKIYCFSTKSSWSEQVSARKSIVLILFPFSKNKDILVMLTLVLRTPVEESIWCQRHKPFFLRHWHSGKNKLEWWSLVSLFSSYWYIKVHHLRVR